MDGVAPREKGVDGLPGVIVGTMALRVSTRIMMQALGKLIGSCSVRGVSHTAAVVGSNIRVSERMNFASRIQHPRVSRHINLENRLGGQRKNRLLRCRKIMERCSDGPYCEFDGRSLAGQRGDEELRAARHSIQI